MSLKKNPEVIALVEAAVAKDRAAQTKATLKSIKDAVKQGSATAKAAGDKAGAAVIKNFGAELVSLLTPAAE